MAVSKKKSNHFQQLMQTSGQARKAGGADAAAATEKRGRRSREEFTQVGAYIPKALYKDVQRRLLDEDRNFSELVEELLADYLVKQYAG